MKFCNETKTLFISFALTSQSIRFTRHEHDLNSLRFFFRSRGSCIGIMFYRRISLPRVISFVLFLTFAFIFWKIFHHGSVARFQHTCNVTDEYHRNLEELLHRVASQLEYHNFVIFLCYGSLWGEIRQSQLFPWAHKAELCILEDHLVEYGRDDFVSDFERNHLKIQYIAADGYYYIESNSIGWSQTISKPFVELYIFAKDRKQSVYRRIGWRRRFLPPHCDWSPSLHCFPTHLIDDSPLPRRRFGHYSYPVPMGHIEMQKYHYASNWWMEIKPKNC